MSRSVQRLTLMFVGPAVMLAVGLYFYLATANYVSTDNAYIQRDKVSVSAEVGGVIVEVNASENQEVAAGELLFRIDPAPFQLAVDEAKAAIATAEARLESLETAYATSTVDIESAKEDIAYFEWEYRRQLELRKTKVATEASIQAAEHALSQARAKLASAMADREKAKAALSTGRSGNGVYPAIQAAKVQLAKAELNLSHTEVRAPVSGVISQSERLQVGQLMVQGLPAVTIVKSGKGWVEANFKETDLEKMRIGQQTDIEVDAYPGLKLSGRVDSIGAGTGSEFSILPAQNASGNWVKVTQRVPVRIAIENMPTQRLIAGLSTHVRINIGN